MIKQKEQKFKLLPIWAIRQSEKSLIVSGGADAQYEVVLESDKLSFFASLKSDKLFTRAELNTYDQGILEQLVTAEIIVPILKKSSRLKVRVISGAKQLALATNEAFVIRGSDQPHDIVVIVRFNTTYADLLGDIQYQDITKPHLFIDMAFHHTLSIGPLVFPGETACIACLQGRTSTRWGDDAPPEEPQVTTKYGKLVAELVATELNRIGQGDTSLTNKTFAWNFKDRVIKKNQLLKVPFCPICAQNKIDHNGALVLPWGKDESITNTI